ncbi:MAG: response regulator [Halobacteriovoraceae bacterium]|nr:response regulator [Halobacteriovoraceae bacterium]
MKKNANLKYPFFIHKTSKWRLDLNFHFKVLIFDKTMNDSRSLRPLLISFGIKEVKSTKTVDEAYNEIVQNEKNEPYTILISTEEDCCELMQMINDSHILKKNFILISSEDHPVRRDLIEDGVDIQFEIERPFTPNLIKSTLAKIQKFRQQQMESVTPLSGKSRILVVDDSETLLQYIKRILNSLGHYRIDLATNVKEAQRLIEFSFREKAPYELIISDWNMPAVTGLTLLQSVKNSQKYQNISFIMITSESSKKNVVDAIKSGVDSFLLKPLPAENVKTKLQLINEKKLKAMGQVV